MNTEQHNLVIIEDENGVDSVGDFIESLKVDAEFNRESKIHLLFIEQALYLLSSVPLKNLLNNKTTLVIDIDGEKRTKVYELIKPLRVFPIYELRYALNGNEHMRFLFFPFKYKDQPNYVFVKCFKKTRKPPVDETNIMRDLTYQMYLKVCHNPQYYLEGMD